jgi:transposase
VARGAPEAVQIADRFHLTRNLGEMLDRFFDRHRAMIKQIERPDAPRTTERAAPSPITAAPPSRSLEAERDRKRVARQARYVEIRERYLKGASMSELARELELNWRTIRKYAQADHCPERRLAPRRPRLLTPYEPYLRRRWADGCHNAMRLHREIVAQGFAGSRIHVARFVTHLRRAPAAATTPAQAAARGLTPRDATWLVLRRAEVRTPAEQAALDQLAQAAPEVERMVTLGERFLALLRERQGTLACDRWVTDAAAGGVPELRRFVIKLKQDLPAVRAACHEDWSNGQTEGQVTKLKLVKRQMFGRANFDLLRRRILLAS